MSIYNEIFALPECSSQIIVFYNEGTEHHNIINSVHLHQNVYNDDAQQML